jgi:hypothetical protein
LLIAICSRRLQVVTTFYRGRSFFQGSITEMKRIYKSEKSSSTAQLSNN